VRRPAGDPACVPALVVRPVTIGELRFGVSTDPVDLLADHRLDLLLARHSRHVVTSDHDVCDLSRHLSDRAGLQVLGRLLQVLVDGIL